MRMPIGGVMTHRATPARSNRLAAIPVLDAVPRLVTDFSKLDHSPANDVESIVATREIPCYMVGRARHARREEWQFGAIRRRSVGGCFRAHAAGQACGPIVASSIGKVLLSRRPCGPRGVDRKSVV